jgi:cell division protein FtsN
MTYDFSFEKKSVAAIFVCSALLCALLFFAGMMVGMGWVTKEDARAADSTAAQQPRAVARPAGYAPQAATRPAATQGDPPPIAYAQPQEPVLYEDPARQEYAAEGYGPRAYDAQPYGGAQGQSYAPQGQQAYAAQAGSRRDYAERDGYGQGGYAAQVYAPGGYRSGTQAPAPESAQMPNAATTGRSEAARLSARNIDPDPRLVQEADAPSEATTNAGARTASPSYSVQIGAYLEETEAQRVARELEDKGYTPRVFSGLDSQARTWYAVRIGSYASARDAGAAASNFSKQEGRSAAVRPAGAL